MQGGWGCAPAVPLCQNMAGCKGGGAVLLLCPCVKIWGELKMQLKNTCEGIHLVKKLPAISLQAFKFTIKMNFTHIFKDFGWILSYYLLWFHGRLFHALMGESFVFQMGGFIFKWERGCGAPWGALVLVGGAKGGGGSKKIIRWGGHSPPPLWETLELWIFFYLGWWFLSKKCHF